MAVAVLGGGEWRMSLCKGLAAEQIVTAKVVAEFLQEAEDVGDAVDGREVEGVLLTVKHGWGIQEAGRAHQPSVRRGSAGQEEPSPLLASGSPGCTKQPVPRFPPSLPCPALPSLPPGFDFCLQLQRACSNGSGSARPVAPGALR